ncbi:hypothetical protein LEM8419_03510 [Neolewinella maritima]|uniref:Uncharacterized protein n=1 Tax=Neolewinella maritima TaxID=1383882 RepID=A0ABM9B5Z0_9BACT|nr:hypothetical protein [Neolewinella maritima]CAH1002638.1 hypothetical protein LEM8419_03510 [Neolewinella maritima]
MTPNLEPFLELDSEEGTKNMALLYHALIKDYAAQGKRPFYTRLTKLVTKHYTLNTKVAISRGKAVGERILSGEGLLESDSLIRAVDTAKVIAVMLQHNHDVPMRHVRQAVRDMGAPYSNLLSLELVKEEPTRAKTETAAVAHRRIDSYVVQPGMLSEKLKALIPELEAVESQNYQNAINAEMTRLDKLRTDTENQRLNLAMEKLRTSAENLSRSIGHLKKGANREEGLKLLRDSIDDIVEILR